MTTPSSPPSRIRRFEPSPMTVTRMSAGRFLRKNARSASSAGWKNSCAGPPTRNQVISLSGWLGISRPRTSEIQGAKLGMQVGPESGLGVSDHGSSGSLPISAPSSAGQRGGPLRDVAGAEADHIVAIGNAAGDQRRERFRPIDDAGVAMAAGADAGDQFFVRHAVDRRLAGGIDRRDDARCRHR